MWIYNLPVFKQLVELLHWILVTLNDLFASWGLGPDWTWGLAIIGLTIIVRLILFPLTWKQYSTAQALQAIQPKVKELQRKYKDDRNKLQAETMRLYSEHRVNPFASCLPLILQLPVFIALYGAISGKTDYLDQTTVKALADAGFLWIKSVAAGGGGLGQPDPTYILLILYVTSQLVSTELMLQTQSDKMQKWLMRSMPIIFVFFLWNFPAGLFVYWVTTNLWTIGQQLLIRKAMRPYQGPAEDADAKPAKRNRIADALAAASHKTHQQKQAEAEAQRSALPKKQGASGSKQQGAARKQGSGAAKGGTGAKTGTKAGSSTKPGASGKVTTGGRPGTKPGARPAGGKPGAPRAKAAGAAAAAVTGSDAREASAPDAPATAVPDAPQVPEIEAAPQVPAEAPEAIASPAETKEEGPAQT